LWLTWRHRGQCWGFKVELDLVLQSKEYFKKIANDEASCKRSQVHHHFLWYEQVCKRNEPMIDWALFLLTSVHRLHISQYF
jgi:hypothetical protein